MSPVEPSPVLIGRMGLPSIARADGLGFLPKNAALSSEGANMPPVSVPSAARNERRFQPNFSFMPIRPFPVAAKDRKSTRLNSSHVAISYAVFCLKKKKKPRIDIERDASESR